MHIAEVFCQPKGKIMEDTHVMTPHYIAVFDGATPKTAFRFTLPDSTLLTPGQMAARTLADGVRRLSPHLSAREAIDALSESLHCALQGHRAEASGVIFSLSRNEVWLVGDCQFAFLRHTLEVHHTEKAIDRLLSQWRASIVKSYLSRGLMTAEEIAANDPGRRIIQPFISRQVRYQNRPTDPLGFGVFDGSAIPDRFIEVFPVPTDASALILASDGYPSLLPTLQESETALQQLLESDPLCIGALCGTKGIQAGNCSHDDRTYLKIEF